jgi:hypothetical protein
MKKINFIVIFIFITKITFSQVGIGTVIPDSNSILDIKSSSKGVLFPRLTRVQRDKIVSDAKSNNQIVEGGLTIYCLDCCTNRTGGSLFFYDGFDWRSFDTECNTSFFPDCLNITTNILSSNHIKNNMKSLFFDGDKTTATQNQANKLKFHNNSEDVVSFELDESVPDGGTIVFYWSDAEPGNQGFFVDLKNNGVTSQTSVDSFNDSILANSTNIHIGDNNYKLSINLINDVNSITIKASPNTNHPRLYEIELLDNQGVAIPLCQ